MSGLLLTMRSIFRRPHPSRKKRTTNLSVIPAKAGIQLEVPELDSRVRGNDKESKASCSKSGFALKLLLRRCASG